VRFYLGTHMPGWLACPEFADVPLFVSRRRLVQRKTCPRAVGPWALDSGGFTELSMYGRWGISAQWYVSDVRRFAREMGMPDFVAPQDWMCEPHITAKTGLSVVEHQRRTVANFLELRDLAPELPWIPVLQGFTPAEYGRCVRMYERGGVDLLGAPLVGVGSVCRRQGSEEIAGLLRELASDGMRLHGFGVKLNGLRKIASCLASSDSMAWSFDGRRKDPLPGCSHSNCANCPIFALEWYERVREITESADRDRSAAGVLGTPAP
jgi:hypothetical protein